MLPLNNTKPAVIFSGLHFQCHTTLSGPFSNMLTRPAFCFINAQNLWNSKMLHRFTQARSRPLVNSSARSDWRIRTAQYLVAWSMIVNTHCRPVGLFSFLSFSQRRAAGVPGAGTRSLTMLSSHAIQWLSTRIRSLNSVHFSPLAGGLALGGLRA